MAGVKGAGGPPPKRSDQRRRVNKPAVEPTKDVPVSTTVVVVPEPDESWHPLARDWFVSLASSGQSTWYTPADWATARVAAEMISRELNPRPIVVGKGADATIEMVVQPVTAAAMQSFLKACTALLATEGDRRRAAIELARTPVPATDGGARVSKLDEYRRRSAAREDRSS